MFGLPKEIALCEIAGLVYTIMKSVNDKNNVA